MGRVNIVKQIKVDGKWTLRSIPKKKSGHYDWAALPDGDYFVEWREDGRRRRQPAGNTAAQAMEEQRRKRHELEAHALGLAPRNETSEVVPAAEPPSVRKQIDRYLDQIKTLKKPNTHRKYDAVLTRFAKVFSIDDPAGAGPGPDSGFDLDRRAERLRRRINEIRDVGKHCSPQRRDHRPVLQAKRKAWPD